MKLSEVTSKFVMNAYQLNDDMPFSVETINGKELLCSKRLDIVAKMKYLELKDISTEFEKIIFRLLRKRPSERYRNTKLFRDAILGGN